MSKQFLLPNKIKFVGCVVFLFGIICCIFVSDDAKWLDIENFPAVFSQTLGGKWIFFQSQNVNLAFTIKSVLLIVGSLLIAFSKEKTEDEFINLLRLRSFQYAVLINSVLLILCYLLFWEMSFISIIVYNLFSTLFFFIIIFHCLLWKNSKRRWWNEK